MEEIAVLPPGPWAAAAAAVALVVGLYVPAGGPRAGGVRARRSPLASATGAVLLAVLAAAAALGARLGPDSELDNPVPALVVGLGWPLLFLLPPLVGAALGARAAAPDGADPAGRAGDAPPPDVLPAVVLGVAVVAGLTVPLSATTTSAVGTGVAAYALLVLAAVVALGRHAAAERVEVLGLLGAWALLGPRLAAWRPPRGAAAVLAVVLGGAWFERLERTSAWVDAEPSRAQVLGGLALAGVLAAAVGGLLARGTRDAPGTAAAVLLPLAGAAVVAGVLRRVLISAQLVAGRPVDPDPFGVVGGQAVALGVVAVGGALAAAVLARRCGPGPARLPGLVVVVAATAVTGAVVLQP